MYFFLALWLVYITSQSKS